MDNKYLYLGILIFIIPSCAVKKQKISRGDSDKESPFDCDDRLLIKKHLAQKQLSGIPEVALNQRFADIPIPLDTVCLQDNTEGADSDIKGAVQLIYKSLLDRPFLIDFFKQQMEVFGWQKEGEIFGGEAVLIFNKIHKKAIISLRSCVTKTSNVLIVISLYATLNNKQGNEDDSALFINR